MQFLVTVPGLGCCGGGGGIQATAVVTKATGHMILNTQSCSGPCRYFLGDTLLVIRVVISLKIEPSALVGRFCLVRRRYLFVGHD